MYEGFWFRIPDTYAMKRFTCN